MTVSVESHLARRGRNETGDHPRQRCLAGTICPEQSHDMMLLDREGDVEHGAERPVAGVHIA